MIENSWWGLIEFTQERVDELSVLVRTIRAKMDLALSEETKRTIIDLLDVEVHITTEGEAKYADVTYHLILDRARLLVAGVEDVSMHTNESPSPLDREGGAVPAWHGTLLKPSRTPVAPT